MPNSATYGYAYRGCGHSRVQSTYVCVHMYGTNEGTIGPYVDMGDETECEGSH